MLKGRYIVSVILYLHIFRLPITSSPSLYMFPGRTYSNVDPFSRCAELEAAAVVRTGSWELPPVSVAIVIVKNVKNASTVKGGSGRR